MNDLKSRARGVLRLSRWRDHMLFTVPATLLGANMAVAHHAGSIALDGRLLAVLAANLLAVTFAFMVNDIEDAPDDARDPARAARNAVATGELSRRAGGWVCAGVSALALLLYAAINRPTAIIGASILLLGWLYSWRPVRLKGLPVIDVISHLLMLSALLVLAGYLAYHRAPGIVGWVMVSAGLLSGYGQLYNQLRDYDADRAAGLHNTASLLGPRGTQQAMYLFLLGTVVTLGITIVLGLWPLWLALIPLIAAPLLVVFQPGTDMRGSQAVDASGRLQLGAMIVANITVLAWLATLAA